MFSELQEYRQLDKIRKTVHEQNEINKKLDQNKQMNKTQTKNQPNILQLKNTITMLKNSGASKADLTIQKESTTYKIEHLKLSSQKSKKKRMKMSEKSL